MTFFPKLSSVFLSSALLVYSGTIHATVTLPYGLKPMAPKDSNYSDLLNETNTLTNLDDVKKAESELWTKFLTDAQTLSTIKAEHNARALKFKDKTMKFTVS